MGVAHQLTAPNQPRNANIKRKTDTTNDAAHHRIPRRSKTMGRNIATRPDNTAAAMPVNAFSMRVEDQADAWAF